MSERERERGTTEGDRGWVKREGVGGEEGVGGGGGTEELRTLLHKDSDFRQLEETDRKTDRQLRKETDKIKHTTGSK